MSDAAIRVDGIGKRYRVGQRESYRALRDVLSNAFRSNGRRKPKDFIWAVRDVSFEVKQGEVVGLIGRNGAGKSTLLKLLARITRPTVGRAELHGRIASLLEVGTGFHPELTGRENIFLSGAILGMSKAEIVRKFDEIVAFSEVERFIDTPLKHYSSGMGMRLAFAVAAHLEPEILLVDEVLSVGDASFQKKCLGKMQDVSRAGRTILFVSHQINQIRRLCQRAFWIDAGQIREHGSTATVANLYEANSRDVQASSDTGTNLGRAQFLRWEIEGANGDLANVLVRDREVRLKFIAKVAQPLRNIHHGVALYDQARRVLWGNGIDGVNLEPGIHELVCAIPSLPLQPGVYHWRVSLYDNGERIDDWDCSPPMFVSTEPRTHRQDEFAGILNVPSEFTIRCLPTEHVVMP
ncbi:MAG TPA: ABC transporter ATP-binding protein [Candidatus Acidoferrales bacterium]|nr:ABC transporter ATP-binding protein [Candidatus Acidoferrales bacterium]HEV3481999.1 ABC transporter ATP-binding protein [Candidatus Acidoferrales bacterium]